MFAITPPKETLLRQALLESSEFLRLVNVKDVQQTSGLRPSPSAALTWRRWRCARGLFLLLMAMLGRHLHLGTAVYCRHGRGGSLIGVQLARIRSRDRAVCCRLSRQQPCRAGGRHRAEPALAGAVNPPAPACAGTTAARARPDTTSGRSAPPTGTKKQRRFLLKRRSGCAIR